MPDTYTSSLRVAQQVVGGNEGTWGSILNASLQALDQGIAGIVSVSVTAGNVTLSTANNADDQARNALLIFTGTPGTTRTVTMPDVEKITHIFNNSDSTVTLTAGAGTTVSVRSGAKAAVYTDGATNVVSLRPDYKEGTFTPVLRFGGGSTGITYNIQSGEYTVIGNRCFYSFQVSLSSKGSSTGIADITGFPFSPVAGGAHLGRWQNIDLDVAGGQTMITGQFSSGNLQIKAIGDNIATASVSDTAFANNSTMAFSGHFQI